MSEIVDSIWHTALLYVLAFVVFRLMGKRAIGHMAPFDVAVIIMIGEAVAIGIEQPDKPILLAVVPVVFLGLLQFTLTLVNRHFRTVERWTQGTNTLLIKDGQVQQKAMDQERMTMADLVIGLREKGITQISQVKEARLEPTGRMSVITNAQESPTTPKTLGLEGNQDMVSVIDQRLSQMKQELLQVMQSREKV